MKRILALLTLTAVLLTCMSATWAEPVGQPGSAEPSVESTAVATAAPTAVPTARPTAEPTARPTAVPTAKPTAVPTAKPTAVPTAKPTAVPTAAPTAVPTAAPTAVPTAVPTVVPTAEPTVAATEAPEEMPLGITDTAVLAEIDRLDAEAEAARYFEGADDRGDTYVDFPIGSNAMLAGITSSVSLYVYLPDYITATDATLRVAYTASDLILTELSSLTFYMNSAPFGSVAVQAAADEGQTVLYVHVPAELLQSGYNLLEIAGYMRLTNDEGCKDDFNGANWLKLSDATCLRVYYGISENADEISMYPYPFLSVADSTGAECAVAVSDTAADAELEAAMTVIAGLGTELSGENELVLSTIGQTERAHIIYIGLAENTPAELLSLLGEAVPAAGAIVRRASAGEREYLLIVSEEPEALMEAARLLSDETRVSQLHTQCLSVSVGESASYMQNAQTVDSALAGQYTLQEVLGHGCSFNGPFEQTQVIYLPVNEDYTLSSTARFSFNIRYSENLDFERSLFTVYWGSGIPLCSRKLSREGAAGETISFAVPSDAVGKAGTTLSVVFDLEIKDLDCTVRQMNTPWAYIGGDSVLYLPQGETGVLSLSSLPAPFQRTSLMDCLVVLPDTATPTELIAAGRMVAMLGAGSSPYGTIRVLRAAEFDAERDGTANIITVGTPEDDPLIASINDSLLFAYEPDGSAIASNSRLILTDTYAAQAGTLQLIRSPWSENAAVLVLSAPQEKGISAITRLISSEKGRWSLTKEAVITDGTGAVSAYQFTVTGDTGAGSEEEKPSFVRVVTENREPMLLLLIGMGCMALMLIGVILVLVRMRRRRRNDE